jgi:hypothetical protein
MTFCFLMSTSIRMSRTVIVSSTMLFTLILTFRISPTDRRYFETRITFNKVSMPLKIPLYLFQHEIPEGSITRLLQTFREVHCNHPDLKVRHFNGAPYYYHPLLDTGPNTHPMSILINAVLTQKRVLFVGYQKPCTEIAQLVLALYSIATGNGRFLRDSVNRVFPYACLGILAHLLETYIFSLFLITQSRIYRRSYKSRF